MQQYWYADVNAVVCTYLLHTPVEVSIRTCCIWVVD